MALTAEHQNFIADVGTIADKLLELQNAMMIANTLWNGAPNWDVLITQLNIDEMPGLAGAGLTVANIGDAIFTIESIRQLIIGGNLPALVLLSRLK